MHIEFEYGTILFFQHQECTDQRFDQILNLVTSFK
jgi:hypothetical protein